MRLSGRGNKTIRFIPVSYTHRDVYKRQGYDPSRTEVVLVNDGCPRDGLEQALKEREKDDRVRVVDLSRNVGHHLAMYVACEEARGERVFLIDSDLEE